MSHPSESPAAAIDVSVVDGPTLFGHPRALYVLFFAELWERFSYYGMRALLMLYMLQHIFYSSAYAGGIYGDYAGLVYLTPLLGGFVADRYLGLRRSIVLGGLLMSLGHGLMSVDDRYHPNQWFMLSALLCLIVGNGFFKPNISTMVGQLYRPGDPRRDAGFTIFYMGINVGAFLAPLACGALGQSYWGEMKDGWLGNFAPIVKWVLGVSELRDDQPLWHLGFGLATIGMLLGLVVFSWGARKYLGSIGLKPPRADVTKAETGAPLTARELAIIALVAIVGIGFAVTKAMKALEPKQEETAVAATPEEQAQQLDARVGAALIPVQKRADLSDLYAVSDLVFEGTVKAATPEVIGGRDAIRYEFDVAHSYRGESLATRTIRVPVRVTKKEGEKTKELLQTGVQARLTPGAKVLAFWSPPLIDDLRIAAGGWGQGLFALRTIEGRMVLDRDAGFESDDPTKDARGSCEDKIGVVGKDERFDYAGILKRMALAERRATVSPPKALTFVRSMLWPIAGTIVLCLFAFLMMRCKGAEVSRVGSIFLIGIFVMVFWGAFEQAGSSMTIFAEKLTRNVAFGTSFESSMYQSVNPLCIIVIAPVFAFIWTWLAVRKKEPPTAFKMFLGLGFEFLAFFLMIGAAKAASGGEQVSFMWLTAAYFLQTLGELCISPVGLSMVTKLAPARFAAMLMGVWFLTNAFANKLAGIGAEQIEAMKPLDFFTFITITLGVAAVVLLGVIPVLRRWMVGVK